MISGTKITLSPYGFLQEAAAAKVRWYRDRNLRGRRFVGFEGRLPRSKSIPVYAGIGKEGMVVINGPAAGSKNN